MATSSDSGNGSEPNRWYAKSESHESEVKLPVVSKLQFRKG